MTKASAKQGPRQSEIDSLRRGMRAQEVEIAELKADLVKAGVDAATALADSQARADGFQAESSILRGQTVIDARTLADSDKRVDNLEADNVTLRAQGAVDARQLLDSQRRGDDFRAQHRATLNLLEDAIIARRETEKVVELLRENELLLEKRVDERTADLAEAHRRIEAESAFRSKVQEERLVLLRQILNAQEEERQRIARDMHDHFGQQLTALRLSLDAMSKMSGEDALMQKVADTQELAKSLDSDVNFLVWELRPTALDDLGLKAALEHFVRKWSEQFDIPADFHGPDFEERELGADVASNLYRIAQEALNNTAKHANANNASVIIERRNSHIVMIVEDDGEGFDTARRRSRGLGLKGMHERAELVGGNLEIESTIGNGTTVYVTVPLKSEMEKINGK